MSGKKFLTGIDLTNQRAINAADPSNPMDLANKQYVDAVARGLSWKESVRAASTTNGDLATAYVNAATLDGVVLATGDRILLKDQTTATENGIYTVNASGAPSRSLDLNTGTDASGMTVTVESGTVNDDRVFTQINDTAVVGTDALAFSQVGGATVYTAGGGLTESPSQTFNVNAGTASATGLEVSSDVVRLAAAAAGDGLTGGGGVPLAVGAGNGLTVTADAVAIDTSVVTRKASATIGDGTATSFLVTHNLGTLDVSVTLRQVSNDEHVMADVFSTNTTQVTVSFASAPAAGAIRVTVQG